MFKRPVVGLLSVACVCFLVGCTTPNQSFIKSVDGFASVILPAYTSYVQKDQSLDEDTVRIRLNTAEQFQKLIDQAKEALSND